jgi:hypothetical protein
LDRRSDVLSGSGALVTRGGGDEVLGHRANDRGEGRSPIEERPSVGGAHREGGDDGCVGFETGEVGRAPVRYGALAWTIGRGGTILSSGRGKVAQGVGIDEGGCGSGFCLAWRREREGWGGPAWGQNKEGGGPRERHQTAAVHARQRRGSGVGGPRLAALWSRGGQGRRQVSHGHSERRRRFPFGLNLKLKQIQINSNLIKL